MIVAGNCRRDLLEDFGREFYADEVDAIRNLYGDCLCLLTIFALSVGVRLQTTFLQRVKIRTKKHIKSMLVNC